MIRVLLLVFFSLLSNGILAQASGKNIIEAEYKAGHFNGAVLVAQDGKLLTQLSRGYANLQFSVPVTVDTRFPIASMTKLFTAILFLQLYERGVLKLEDPAARYVAGLPAACQTITIWELLTHRSGLLNEPRQAYRVPYSTTEFVKNFVVRKDGPVAPTFNYNNVDYILLTRVLEEVARKPYADIVREAILQPLQMSNSGVVSEAGIIPRLAYGYHNYSFGANQQQAPPLQNDPPHLANYAGAGAMYSTTADLYKLVQGLKANRLLSAQTTATLLTAPQGASFVEDARGVPTIGFYHNAKTFRQPVLERRGSINGFNSVLLTDPTFNKVVILLTNTDTGDLEVLGDKLYRELSN